MATKYWVGNGGNWSDTAHWALSSGGTGGAALPTIDDDVYFDDSSFTLSDQTVFVDVDIDVKYFEFYFSNEQPSIPYPAGRVDNITIDFNEHTINTYEGLTLYSFWSSVFNLSNSTVTGSFIFMYECPIPTDNLILSNTNFVLDMIIASSPQFQIICNSEEQSEQQSNCVFNISTFRVIFEGRCNPYIGLYNDLHIDNFIVVDETIYDDPLLYGFPPDPSHELYLNFEGSSYTYKKVSVNFDHINVGWDVDSTKFIKKGAYSYTQYKEISYDFPYSFTINNLIKERSVSTFDQILGEWVLATKVENNPQIHEYSVSSEGVFTFNEANAVDGVLIDYFYIDDDESPDSFIIFNLDEQFQYNTHYRNSDWDGGNINLILNESQNLNGIIKILKPGEYLLNSITINTSATQITGNLYLNNLYCNGEPDGTNNILTGNGVDWNIISYADYISISNTTLSDSNASGSTFYAYYSNGNIDGGNNTVWIFEDVMHITDFYPNMGTYGTEITITGISFPETPMVTFGGVPAVVDSSTSTQIITHVPIGAITGPITVDDYVSVTPFTVLTPIIENITPLHGPVRTVITITGSNFYKEPVITFHNGIVATIDSWNENQIITSVPFGTTTGPLTINFDDILYETTFTLGWSIVCSHGIINVKLTKIYSSDAYGGAEFRSYISNGCFDGGNNTGWIFDGYDPTEHKRRTQDPLTKYQITIIDTTGKSGS